ncbi:MAG: glycosyltransferase [Acidobacteriaceae bacterium]|nr:glycosyltransferase [Acidobacteriaceae bacterium]
MRLVIFGLTVSSSWGNGHATIWRGLCGALGATNHCVTFFEKDVSYYREHRDLVDPAQYKLRLYSDWEEIEPDARRELANADCAIVTSYCPDARAAVDLIFSSNVPRRVFYDLDTPVTLRALDETDVPYIPHFGLGPFDLVLSYTGGMALEELKSRLGARRVAPLYGCVDMYSHRRVSLAHRYNCDFSYLGTYATDRQAQLNELFLEPARKTPQKKFCLGGALYPADFQWSDNIYFVRHLPPDEHPAFFSSSKLTLNITRSAMADMGYCPSGRLFEAAACGTPIVSDWWEGLQQFFAPGDEILVANNSDDVIEALNLDVCKLQVIARAAQERVLAQHTAPRRAAELIDLLEG